jgi:hypothetical protein
MNNHPRSALRHFVPEEQLLMQCSRVALTAENRQSAAALLRQSLDWQYILEVSIRHGISPLFYQGLQQASETADLKRTVPPTILAELGKLYDGTGTRNRRLYGVVGDIVKACDQVDTPIMGLKDLQLAREVYPDLGLRPMGDLDLLIHRADYEKVSRCLHELGFLPLPQADIPFTLKYASGHQWQRPSDNVWVDLQWTVMQREWDVYGEGSFSFASARLWSQAVSLAIDDYRLLAPRPEDMLFHLCLHLEGHQDCEFILFCDIAEFLKTYATRFDWQYFIQLTKAYRAESSVYYVLLLTQHLFGLCLTPQLMRELEPIYFQAPLFGPLFGNLTALHESLDALRLSSAPPREVTQKCEITVRSQAAGAMQMYKELDQLASTFVHSGGTVIIPDGSASERIFPDPSLGPFGPVTLCLLADDLPQMEQTLSAQGFQTDDDPTGETYQKEWTFASRDPILAQQPLQLQIRAIIEKSLSTFLQAYTARKETKKDTALRSLRGKFVGRAASPAILSLAVTLLVLSPEEAFVWLGTRLGTQQQDRLFYLCFVLELLRGYHGQLSWPTIHTIAQQNGVSRPVAEAVRIVAEFVSPAKLPTMAHTLFATAMPPTRMLEWARYGPDDLVRHTDLKQTFYYLFSLLSIEGIKGKSVYLLQSLFGLRGKPSMPAVLLRDLLPHVVSLFQQKSLTTRDFAYWIEPTSASTPGPSFPVQL